MPDYHWTEPDSDRQCHNWSNSGPVPIVQAPYVTVTDTGTWTAEALEPDPEPHRLGWVPSMPDHRDRRWAPPTLAKLPAASDLRNTPFLNWPIFNQGQLGSCTANAISGAIQTQELKQADPVEVVPSRLFIYYCERQMEGTVDTDSGAQIRDGMKCVNRLGYVDEKLWPYDVNRFTEAPPASVFLAARRERVLKYQRLPQTATALKTWLAGGHPFVGGITVASSFPMQPIAGLRPGQVPIPQPQDQPVGGHALLWVGYDDNVSIEGAQGAFVFRNSWGEAWGDHGYGYLPYDYLTDPYLAQDFWGITLTEA